MMKPNDIKKNKTISLVIKNFVNKGSGKVVESRNEIKRRFNYLDWKDQKKIALAFLTSTKTDRNWIYKRLLYLWDKSFEKEVIKVWETYHEERCSWLVVKYLPWSYVKTQWDRLLGGHNYYFLCRRFTGVEKEFVPDLSLLATPLERFDIMARMLDVTDTQLEEAMKEILKGICDPLADVNLRNEGWRSWYSLLDFKIVYRAVCLLKEAGREAVVETIHRWDTDIMDVMLQEDADFVYSGHHPDRRLDKLLYSIIVYFDFDFGIHPNTVPAFADNNSEEEEDNAFIQSLPKELYADHPAVKMLSGVLGMELKEVKSLQEFDLE